MAAQPQMKFGRKKVARESDEKEDWSLMGILQWNPVSIGLTYSATANDDLDMRLLVFLK